MEAIERNLISTDWITFLLTGTFILLAFIRNAYPYKFSDFVLIIATDKYLRIEGREPNIKHPFNTFMFIVNVVSASLFIYIIYSFFNQNISRPLILFIRIATAYSAFVLIKFSIEKILGNILAIDKTMEYFHFYKLSYRNFIALFLLPINIFLLYVWQPNLTGIIVIGSMIFLFNLIIILDILKKSRSFISAHLFYFILYLCALEIAPYFILYKLITVR